MTNVAFKSIEAYRDIETRHMHREFVEERGMELGAVMAMIHAKSRDNAQTPMQWDGSEAARVYDRNPLDRGQPELPRDQRRALAQ